MSDRSIALSRRGFLQAGLATGVGFFAFGRDFWTEAIAAPAQEGASPYGPLLGPAARGFPLPEDRAVRGAGAAGRRDDG